MLFFCTLQWVLPELVATASIPVLLLLTWHWIVFLITCPFAAYLIYRYNMHGIQMRLIYSVTSCGCRYMTLPPGSMGMYDPTEIRNRGMLLRFQKEAFVKIGYHLVVFFILLYW